MSISPKISESWAGHKLREVWAIPAIPDFSADRSGLPTTDKNPSSSDFELNMRIDTINSF